MSTTTDLKEVFSSVRLNNKSPETNHPNPTNRNQPTPTQQTNLIFLAASTP